VDEKGAFQPFNESSFQLIDTSPHLFEGKFNGDACKLEGTTPIDLKGIEFQIRNDSSEPLMLRFEVEGFPHKNLWATPARKMERDWGYNRWKVIEDNNALLHTYSNPIDATRTPCTALWFDRAWSRHSIPAPPSASPALAAWIEVEVPAKEGLRFGFLHADRRRELVKAIEKRSAREDGLQEETDKWSEWVGASLKAIEENILPATTSQRDTTSPLGPYRKTFIDPLIQSRSLFLSNGGVLTRPMTLAEFPLDVRDQGIGLCHWKEMGLDFPLLERWRDLVRYNPYSERCIEIDRLGGDRIDRLFRGQTAILAAPDPRNPPSKRMMDVLLGYVVSGGKVTLIDGVAGFEEVEGWWKEEGFQDPADYALSSFGIELVPNSRQRLDEEGLDGEVNTFCIGMGVYLEGNSDTPIETTTVVPGGGYLIVYPRSAKPGEGVTLERGSIGGASFVPFTPSEDEILEASYGSRVEGNELGIPIGRSIEGEGFVAYRLPGTATVECALELSGKWKVAWSQAAPRTTHTLIKKAFQEWYLRELLTAEVSRLAHPIVYGATWGARVFDVTGTELSPVLFRKIGRGSFVWIGLPRDYLLLGSDTGTDWQNSLRQDPTYDLVRMTLALHDPERGGGQQAGAPPARGWTSGGNRSTEEGPRTDRAFFAWKPTQFLGGGAGSGEYWTWAMDCFFQASQQPDREGRRLGLTELAIRDWGEEGKCVDLYSNACRYALYADMAAQSNRQGMTWWRNQVEKRAKEIENNLLAILDLGSATPVWGRVVKNGSAEEVIPLEEFLPEAVWTVSEIRGVRFPGGEAARNRVIEKLQAKPSSIGDPRSRAALATLPGAEVEELLKGIFPGEEFDLAVALPAMRAICDKIAQERIE
jgi:hypothetical protein